MDSQKPHYVTQQSRQTPGDGGMPCTLGEEASPSSALFHPHPTPASAWDPGLPACPPKRCFCTGSLKIRCRGLIEDMRMEMESVSIRSSWGLVPLRPPVLKQMCVNASMPVACSVLPNLYIAQSVPSGWRADAVSQVICVSDFWLLLLLPLPLGPAWLQVQA